MLLISVLSIPPCARWGYQWLPFPLSAEEHRHGIRGEWLQQTEHSPHCRSEEEELPCSSDQDALCSHQLLYSEIGCCWHRLSVLYSGLSIKGPWIPLGLCHKGGYWKENSPKKRETISGDVGDINNWRGRQLSKTWRHAPVSSASWPIAKSRKIPMTWSPELHPPPFCIYPQILKSPWIFSCPFQSAPFLEMVWCMLS